MMAFKLQYTMRLLSVVVIIPAAFCMPPPLPTTVPTTTRIPTTTIPTCPTDEIGDECRHRFCHHGTWAYFETIKSEKCCLIYPNPICEQMFPELFTPPTTAGPPAPPTTPPTTTKAGCPPNPNSNECLTSACIDGVWLPFEPVMSVDCCRRYPNPICLEFFPELITRPPTLPRPETTPRPPSSALVSGPPTTPPPTTKAGCPPNPNSNECMTSACINGVWLPFEPVMSEDCCRRYPNPMCSEFFPEPTNTPPTPPRPPTTPRPLSSALVSEPLQCKIGTHLYKGCTVYSCIDGRWAKPEVRLTKDCCLENIHQAGCENILQQTEPECVSGKELQKGCAFYLCIDGSWEKHKEHYTKECCLENRHQTGCDRILHQIVEVKVEAMCKEGEDKLVEECIVHVCKDGQWLRHSYHASRECCEKDKSQKVCQQLF